MDQAANRDLLLRGTAEFSSKEMEESFLRFSWNENKVVVRNTLLVIGFLSIAFFIRDIIEVRNRELVYLLLSMRLVAVLVLLLSALQIHRADNYFENYHYLLLVNQIMISTGVFILAVMRNMPIAYLGVNTLLFTLIFYQFLNNRFYYTLTVCIFLGLGALVTSIVYLNMHLSEFIGSVLFLVPVNILGITILRSINRARRYGYLALIDSIKANEEKGKLIHDLKATLAEVKTLRGFLPICSGCNKIRDDAGYWNQIEKYFEEHSDVEFSHSLCPECAKRLYGDQEWYDKLKHKL